MTAGTIAVASLALLACATADSCLAYAVLAMFIVPVVAYLGIQQTLGFMLPGQEADSASSQDKDGEEKDSGAGSSEHESVFGMPDPNRFKPFPWDLLPDNVAWTWGALVVIFVAPIVAVVICTTVPAMSVLKAIWNHKHTGFMRNNIPEMVRSVSRPLGRLLLLDPRNHSYIPWMAVFGLYTPCVFAWAMWRYNKFGLEFTTLALYHILRIGPRFQFFGHAHTLVHKAGHDHKGFFKAPFQILNPFVEWWCTPFYGVVPNSFSIAHMKIHHRWHNDVGDLHTNLDLDRTLSSSFFIYVPRFMLYWTGVSCVMLFAKRQEWNLFAQQIYGMVYYYGIAFMFWKWDRTFCLLYWLYPHAEAITFLCAISYLWHAFVEESDPNNQYVNSLTILEGHDNIWNEDYHVVHHHEPNVHWSNMPESYKKHIDDYAKCNATIFRDTEEGMLLKMMFTKDFKGMAKHFVDLNGTMTMKEKEALLKRRLQVVVGEKGRKGGGWASSDTIRDFGQEKTD